MTADLSDDARMEYDNIGRGGGAGPSRSQQQTGGGHPGPGHQGQHQQVSEDLHAVLSCCECLMQPAEPASLVLCKQVTQQCVLHVMCA